MHVGDVRESQLVIGNYNTVQTPKGAKVTVIQAGTVPAPTLRAMPVRFRAAARVEAVGRDEELALAGSASPESPVELYGGDGIGKTTVLKLVAEDPSPPSEGVAFESIRRRSLDEVQAKLYSVFWECEVPFLPGPAEIGEYLADRDALLLLDDCELDRDDLGALLDCAPRSTFVIGSETRNLWSQGTARRLTGLKPAAGVALLERELGRAIEPGQREDAEAVVERLEGRPQSLVETAALVLDGRASLAELARDAPAMARRIDAETLTASQRRILAVLGAIDGAALGVEHVAELADAPDAERELADLERRGWVKGQSPRYRLIRPLPSGLAPPAPAEIADPLLDNLGVWARERATPTTIADEAEAIEAALAIGAGSGRWRAALSLAAAAGSRLPLAGAWAASRRVLSAGLAAARALRRESAEAYFLHQLGSLALLLGESEDAISQLNQALQMRERLGDREGAELTRHNLGQIGGGPGSNGGGGNGGGPWRPHLGVVLAVVAALAVLIMGGVVLASKGGGGADKPPQLSAPADHKTHSANRGPTRQTSPTTPAGEAGSTTPAGEAGSKTPTCQTGPTGTSSISGNTCISGPSGTSDGVSGTSDGVSGTSDGVSGTYDGVSGTYDQHIAGSGATPSTASTP